ncbi:MAG: T9SS type A sorting domain-containing protein [Bacteroidetes bacterium]|nr:T9SS type A sorting domain-containing protein [Bacteroidota bacterium]
MKIKSIIKNLIIVIVLLSSISISTAFADTYLIKDTNGNLISNESSNKDVHVIINSNDILIPNTDIKINHALSINGTFCIDGAWIEGIVFTSAKSQAERFIRISPPWAFVGQDKNGNSIKKGSNDQGIIIIFNSPVLVDEEIQEAIDKNAIIVGLLKDKSNLNNENNSNKKDHIVSTVNSDLESELNITYNSTNEEIQIISPAKQIDIVVSDLNGKNVYSIKNSNTTTISTKNLPQAEGAYILKITSNGQSATKKIILSNGKCYFSSEK